MQSRFRHDPRSTMRNSARELGSKCRAETFHQNTIATKYLSCFLFPEKFRIFIEISRNVLPRIFQGDERIPNISMSLPLIEAHEANYEREARVYIREYARLAGRNIPPLKESSFRARRCAPKSSIGFPFPREIRGRRLASIERASAIGDASARIITKLLYARLSVRPTRRDATRASPWRMNGSLSLRLSLRDLR